MRAVHFAVLGIVLASPVAYAQQVYRVDDGDRGAIMERQRVEQRDAEHRAELRRHEEEQRHRMAEQRAHEHDHDNH
jgi:hypothetical protein